MTQELSQLGDVIKVAYEAEDDTNALTNTLLGLINSTIQQDGSKPLTANWDLDGFAITSVKLIGFDVAYTVTGSEPVGATYWDDANKTLSTVLGNGVVGQHFQESFIVGQNNTGVTIADGKAVSYGSAIGASGNIRIVLGQASAATPTFMQLGITTESIVNGASGRINTYGKVRGIQTDGVNYDETWVNSDIIYVSGTVAGALTNIAPVAPTPAIPVAVVISSHATNGTLLVRPTFPQKFIELSDVDGTELNVNGQMVVWDNDNQYFDFTINISDFATPMAFNAGLTAYATGGQANAIQLVVGANIITVCATAEDSAKLPAAVAKRICIVHNKGDERADLYPDTDDEIEHFGINNPVVLNISGTLHLLAIDDTIWIQI